MGHTGTRGQMRIQQELIRLGRQCIVVLEVAFGTLGCGHRHIAFSSTDRIRALAYASMYHRMQHVVELQGRVMAF